LLASVLMNRRKILLFFQQHLQRQRHATLSHPPEGNALPPRPLPLIPGHEPGDDIFPKDWMSDIFEPDESGETSENELPADPLSADKADDHIAEATLERTSEDGSSELQQGSGEELEQENEDNSLGDGLKQAIEEALIRLEENSLQQGLDEWLIQPKENLPEPDQRSSEGGQLTVTEPQQGSDER
jgi:hypothetical protein